MPRKIKKTGKVSQPKHSSQVTSKVATSLAKKVTQSAKTQEKVKITAPIAAAAPLETIKPSTSLNTSVKQEIQQSKQSSIIENLQNIIPSAQPKKIAVPGSLKDSVAQSKILESSISKFADAQKIPLKFPLPTPETGMPPPPGPIELRNDVNEIPIELSEFEKLSNISTVRPEIIAMTNFCPLYNNEGNTQTKHGELYFRYWQKLRDTITAAREEAANNASLKTTLAERNAKVIKDINDLDTALRDMYNSLRVIRGTKSISDINNSNEYKIDYSSFIQQIIPDTSIFDKQKILDACAVGSPTTGIVDLLYDLTGLSKDQISELSPTRMWVYLVKETGRLTTGTSRKLDNTNFSSAAIIDIPLGIKTAKLSNKNQLPSLQSSTWSSDINALGQSYLFKSDVITTQEKELNEGARLDYDYKANTNFGVDNVILQQNFSNIGSSISNITKIIQNLSQKHSPTSLFYVGAKEVKNNFIAAGKSRKEVADFWLGQQSTFEDISLQDFYGSIPNSENFNSSWTDEDLISVIGLAKTLAADGSQITTFEPSTKDKLFDETKLVQAASSGDATQATSQLNSLYNKANDFYTNFNKMLNSFSVLPAVNAKITEGKYSPSIISSNIEISWQRASEKLVAALLDPSETTTTAGGKNQSAGAHAVFKFASNFKQNARAADIASTLFLMLSYDMTAAETARAEGLNVIDYILLRNLSGYAPSSAVWTEINNDIEVKLRYYSKTFYEYSGLGTTKNSSGLVTLTNAYTLSAFTSFLEYIQNGDSNFSWRWARFLDHKELGNSIRNSKIYKTMKDVMFDVRQIYTGEYSPRDRRLEREGSELVNLHLFLGMLSLCSSARYSLVRAASKDNQGIKTLFARSAEIFSSTTGESDPFGAGFATSNDIDKLAKFLNATNIVSSRSDLRWGLTLYIEDNPQWTSLPPIAASATKGLIKREITLLCRSNLAILQFIKTLRDKTKSALDAIDNFSKSDLDVIKRFVDTENIPFLFTEEQMMLARSTISDLQRRSSLFSTKTDVSPDDSRYDFINNFEYDFLRLRPKRSVDAFVKDPEFGPEKGYNKKIMTVGLPQGIFKHYVNQITKADPSAGKNDVFKLKIHKIDLLNASIRYKPKSYLFESSRFVSRVPEDIKESGDLISRIPFRNYSFNLNLNNTQKGSIFYAAQDGDFTSNLDAYDFLSPDERKEISANHIISYLLSSYIKTLTGMNLDETSFNLTRSLAIALKQDLDLFTVGTPTTPPVVQPSQNIIDVNLLDATRVALSESLTSEFFLKKMICPKKFDRVFNIIFDPEFMVDEDSTKENNGGTEQLNSLFAAGRLIKTTISGKNYYVDQDVTYSTGLPSLHAFFATFETHRPKFENYNPPQLQDDTTSASSNRPDVGVSPGTSTSSSGVVKNPASIGSNVSKYYQKTTTSSVVNNSAISNSVISKLYQKFKV